MTQPGALRRAVYPSWMARVALLLAVVVVWGGTIGALRRDSAGSWTTLGPQKTLYAVWGVNATTAFAVGAGGTAQATTAQPTFRGIAAGGDRGTVPFPALCPLSLITQLPVRPPQPPPPSKVATSGTPMSASGSLQLGALG